MTTPHAESDTTRKPATAFAIAQDYWTGLLFLAQRPGGGEELAQRLERRISLGLARRLARVEKAFGAKLMTIATGERT